MYVYVCVCMYTYIYIYIYIKRFSYISSARRGHHPQAAASLLSMADFYFNVEMHNTWISHTIVYIISTLN